MYDAKQAMKEMNGAQHFNSTLRVQVRCKESGIYYVLMMHTTKPLTSYMSIKDCLDRKHKFLYFVSIQSLWFNLFLLKCSTSTVTY